MKKLFLFIAATLVTTGMWAEDFDCTEITTSGTTREGITVKRIGLSTTSKAPCGGGSNVSSVAFNGNGDTGSNGAATNCIVVSSANAITSLTVEARSNNSSSGNLVLVFYSTEAGGTTCSSYVYDKGSIAFNGSSAACPASQTITPPSGTKRIEIYRRVNINGTTMFESGNDYRVGATVQFNVFSLSAESAPSLPEATKFTVGLEGNNPCVSGGESATITLSGSQSGVSYQLYKGEAAVDGQLVAGTGSAISFTEIVEAGTYTVKSVANASYSATTMTGSAVVTLAESPVITTQPTASQKIAIKSPLSLSVESSTEGVNYQWYSNTSASTEGAEELAGKETAILSITSAATATTTYYYCVISKDGMCAVASDFAEVITKVGCETETLATSTITGAKTDTHSGCTTTVKLQDNSGKLNDGAYYEMSLTGGFQAGDKVIVNVKANNYESGKLYMVYGTHESYTGYQVQDGPTEGNTANVEFVIPSDMATIAFLRTTTTTDGDKTQNHEIKSVTVKRETCYIDPTTAISNTEVEVKAIKRIENGVLVIEKDGKTYNVMGVRIR